MVTAAAGTGDKASYFLQEALNCKNPKFINLSALEKDRRTGEMRISELTPLMIACIVGKLAIVQQLVEAAKLQLKPEVFETFINVKVTRIMGGYSALLYAINSNSKSNENVEIVKYLVNEANADPDSMNDSKVNCLILASKKA